MTIKEAIEKRRAYRSLKPIETKKELINDLAECAQLFCSCFNNQPWRFIFAYEPEILKELHTALSPGNEWAKSASLIIVVFSNPGLDCVLKTRKYYLFDTGMATAAIILRATELGLVAHPIAGYEENNVKEILKIPDSMEVIALIIVGERSETLSPILSEKQIAAEKNRPERMPLEKFVWLNQYQI